MLDKNFEREGRKTALVATYEEYLELPLRECMTEYFGDYGGHFKLAEANGYDENIFEERFQAALKILNVNESEYFSNPKYGTRIAVRDFFDELKERENRVDYNPQNPIQAFCERWVQKTQRNHFSLEEKDNDLDLE